MKISVVIPTFNRANLLNRVLWSLHKQNDKNYEVIVCNDDDLDREHETIGVCKEFVSRGMPLSMLRTNQYKRGREWSEEKGWNTGEGWSNESYPFNAGIRQTTGDIILLNSGDTMSVTNTIEQHRQWQLTHEKTCLVTTTHALTPETQAAIDTYDWLTDARNLLFDGSCWNLYAGFCKSYKKGCPVLDERHPFHFLMSVPRQALFDIRGFDEDFYGYMPYGDDDMAWRLGQWGLTFHWDESVVAIHQSHGEPGLISPMRTSCLSNPAYDGGGLYHERRGQSIIRNAKHEWGQYPRDMKNLPVQSGPVTKE